MEIKTIPITKAECWDKNPRNITKKNFKILKKQITELKPFKPLIACWSKKKRIYEILGGNMRFRAYQEMKFQNIDVSIVHADTEAEKLKYALADNDEAGYYDKDALGELIYNNQKSINMKDFKIKLSSPKIDLQYIMDGLKPGEIMPKEEKKKTCPHCGKEI